MPRKDRTLVWFRGKDLRLADHGPLARAMEGGEVIPVFVFDPYFFHPLRARKLPHRKQFLLESISNLSTNLSSLGSSLVCLPGRSVEVIPRVAAAWDVSRVVAHRWIEPFGRVRDTRIAKALPVPLELHEGETLHPPGLLRLYAILPRPAPGSGNRAPPRPAPDPRPRASRRPRRSREDADPGGPGNSPEP